MLTPLSQTTRARCGGKAATLATLMNADVPVPDGFVVPFDARTDAVADRIAESLARLGDPPVAVRSSALDEDTEGASAAGQYESSLGVRGVRAVCEAIAACRESAHTARVAQYRRHTGGTPAASGMAVLVQRLVDADVSGVMFTPRDPTDVTRIEASWGLGESVVRGAVDPDSYEVAPDGTTRFLLGGKAVRIDANGSGATATRPVTAELRHARALHDDDLARLVALGRRVADVVGAPQDIEWAVVDGEQWILQSRPVTAPLPALPVDAPTGSATTLTGAPGSRGTVTATARVVRGRDDFPAVSPGDVVVCPYTDPAWTPLFTVASAVVTETGGVLSHAAIVAREYGIPAVLGVTGATTRIRTDDRVTVDGAAGTVTVL
ncbi:pyruvate,water dikinase [Stackebrandtia albiflava]|uniref:Pyruvate,water dikinase n=1 Tax=Stackebrandtia albiflava TaxID=406432 RepID=A0A562VA63_9ACTN|nr:PEP/pyruvate-binding domain-containing protein [Stackebrandtia albiflava]TWJ14755.1 pyruvate,water dikinase [Stackebrandtia albiflava]